MRELSLFSGAGGGLQGTLLLGWKPVGYVEFNEYCQRVIAQRIVDGVLPNAPIFTDMRKFLESGSAREYRGFADVVTAGWPCQPHSSAGKRLGANDGREGWPWVIETIRQVKPRWFLGENVRGILSTDSGRYFGAILRDLAHTGYRYQWGVLSACAFGAPHPRERVFIVAHANDERCQRGRECKGSPEVFGRGKENKRPHHNAQGATPLRSEVWDTAETDILGMADGMGSRLERISAAGNGQVPVVVAAAWHLLSKGLDH